MRRQGGGGNEVVLTSDPLNDGFATQGGGYSAGFLLVGDETSNDGIVGLHRFPLVLPAGATVVQAVLETYQFEVIGSPYAGLGDLRVDSIDLDDGVGAGLDEGDYSSAAFSTVPGSLSSSSTLGPRSIDVTAAVQADVAAGRANSDFRIYFQSQTDGNGTEDQVKLISASDDGGTGRAPTLTITLP
jgi:hypothetical protein